MRLLIPFVYTFLLLNSAVAGTLRDFSSDGCSLFPDGDLKDRSLLCNCCFSHDIAYWQGGTEKEREQADQDLRECVLARTNSKALADLMYEGVRAGGHPVFPTWYRWGYGWDYGRGYEPLSAEEKKQVRNALKEYEVKHPSGYCPGNKPRNSAIQP